MLSNGCLTECSADVVCVHDQQRIRRIGNQSDGSRSHGARGSRQIQSVKQRQGRVDLANQRRFFVYHRAVQYCGRLKPTSVPSGSQSQRRCGWSRPCHPLGSMGTMSRGLPGGLRRRRSGRRIRPLSSARCLGSLPALRRARTLALRHRANQQQEDTQHDPPLRHFLRGVVGALDRTSPKDSRTRLQQRWHS